MLDFARHDLHYSLSHVEHIVQGAGIPVAPDDYAATRVRKLCGDGKLLSYQFDSPGQDIGGAKALTDLAVVRIQRGEPKGRTACCDRNRTGSGMGRDRLGWEGVGNCSVRCSVVIRSNESTAMARCPCLIGVVSGGRSGTCNANCCGAPIETCTTNRKPLPRIALMIL